MEILELPNYPNQFQQDLAQGSQKIELKFSEEISKLEDEVENKDETIQPIGCADPTFIGANFDLQEITLAGVRLVVATLLRGNVLDSDFDWDIANVSLKKDGVPILPEWQKLTPTSYSDCEICKK